MNKKLFLGYLDYLGHFVLQKENSERSSQKSLQEIQDLFERLRHHLGQSFVRQVQYGEDEPNSSTTTNHCRQAIEAEMVSSSMKKKRRR